MQFYFFKKFNKDLVQHLLFIFQSFFNIDMIAFVNTINIPTNPAYITITRNENPISTGNSIAVKIDAKIIKQRGTPKIYQYNNAFVFFALDIFIPSCFYFLFCLSINSSLL